MCYEGEELLQAAEEWGLAEVTAHLLARNPLIIELRAYIPDIETTRSKIEELGSVFKGEYAFKDHFYADDVRIRTYSKTNWDQKLVELSQKTNLANSRSNHHSSFKKFAFTKNSN